MENVIHHVTKISLLNNLKKVFRITFVAMQLFASIIDGETI